MFCISMYRYAIDTKLHLDLRASINLQIEHFLSYLCIQDLCMFFISKYRKGVDATLHLHYKTKHRFWKRSFFYHGYIYRISVCFVFPYTMKVSILNYTCNTTPSAHLEIDHFLSWLYIPDFRMFCISMYSEGINTKPYLHYKTNCTSWNWIFFIMVIYTGFLYVLYFHIQWRYQY